jgi:hypothetical protein
VNHKNEKQNDFFKVPGNLGDYEDYHFLGFHATWSGRSVTALLKDLLPLSSGQEIFSKPDKVVQSPV